MESLEQRRKEEITALERGLRWLLIVMLGAVFVIRFLPGMVQLLSTLPQGIEQSELIIQGFALLLLVTALALLAERNWAFLLLYVTVMVATLVMAVSLVPGVVGLLRPEWATEGVIAANIVVLILGAYCHWLQKNRNVQDLS